MAAGPLSFPPSRRSHYGHDHNAQPRLETTTISEPRMTSVGIEATARGGGQIVGI